MVLTLKQISRNANAARKDIVKTVKNGSKLAAKAASKVKRTITKRSNHDVGGGLQLPGNTRERKEANLTGGQGLNEPTVGAPTDVVKNGRNGAATGAISGKHASKPESNIGAVAQIVKARKSRDYMDFLSAAEQLADLAAESKTQRDAGSFLRSNLRAMCEKLSLSDRKLLARESVVGIPGYGSNDRSDLGTIAAKALEGVLKELGYTTEAI